MSKVVDERVVEMRFDNRQFEQNVSATMSTLDKFKQKLNFRGVGKGFEDIGAAAKKVDMNGLGAGVEAVSAKFSALQVMGVTALANITNSAVNAGKRIVSALTIDPVKTGFQEYETQMNAVQTILANTQSKGSTLKDVNEALDELNHYADLTIYNFTEMTRNIGTFTAAGVDLETSVNAIQGIANLAAVSGSTSQQASTAMYQLSQALAAGTVKLMDWNSVVNAGMGGEVFQNALKETSRLLGTGADAAIKAEGSFRESLSTGWLTSEVLTETLKKFTTSGANEYVAKYTGLSVDAVKATLESAEAQYGEADAINQAAKALANKSGKSEAEIKKALEMAKTAEDAATKVKTFSQLWDVMKEAAQSGWSQTWQIIIGDFEAAKNLLTPLADFFTNVIGKMSDARNNLLKGALGMGFGDLAKKLDTLLTPAKKAAETVNTVKTSVADLGKVVDSVIIGKFGNGKERFDKLTEAGQNYYAVQNKVNEKLGNAFRYTKEQISAQDKLLGSQSKTAESTSKTAEATGKLTDEQKNLLKELASMSEEQAKSKGYTDEQIKAFKELGDTADKLGMPLDELIDNLDEINGRWLIINSFKNIGQGLITVIKSIANAWHDVFPPLQSEQLFNVIAGFHKLTTYMRVSDETADKLRRTFRGVFAILDIVSTVVGGPIKVGLKLLGQLLGSFDLSLLDVTAAIGDAIVKFRDWVDSIFDFEKLFKTLSPYLKTFTSKVKEVFKALKQSKVVDKVVSSFKKLQNILKKLANTIKKFATYDISNLSFSQIKDIFADIPDKMRDVGSNIIEGLKSGIGNLFPEEMREIGRNIIEGLQNGIGDKFSAIIAKAREIGTMIIETVKGILGIHSPSTVMFEIGENIVAGLVNGIASGIKWLFDTVGEIGSYLTNLFKTELDISPIVDSIKKGFDKLKSVLSEFDWKKLLAIIPVAVVLIVVKQMYDFVQAINEGIGSVSSVIDGLGDVERSFAKVLNAKAFETAADALVKIAKSIAILAGAIVIISLVDETKLYRSVGVLLILSIVLTSLAKAMSSMQSASAKIGKDGLKLTGVKTGLLTLTAALLILAYTVKLVGELDPETAKQGFIGLAGLLLALVSVFAAYGLLIKGKAAQNMDKAGSMLLKMSISLLILVGVTKLLSGITWPEMGKAAAFVAGFTLFVAGLVYATKAAGRNISKVGTMLIKISFALGLMVGVCKLVNTLSPEEMKKGAAFAGAFSVFVAILVLVTKIDSGKQIAKISGLLLSISISLMLMVGVCKLVSNLKTEEMLKGAAFLAGFMIFIKILVMITQIGGEQKIAKVAATILAMSIAVGILAGVAVLLSLLDPQALFNGVAAVSALGIVMALMVAATKGAEKCVGNIVALAIAVGVMAGAVAVLSTIDGEKLAAATLALTIVMGMFAIILKIAGDMSNVTLTLLAMSVAIAVLGGVLYLLGGLPAESSLAAALALSVAMLAFAAAMRIIAGMQSPSGMAIVAIAVMALVVVALGGVLYMLQDLDPVQGIAIVGVLSAFLAALLVAVLAMQFLQAPSVLAMVALGVVTLVVAALGGVLYMLQGLDPYQSIAMVGVLSAFLAALLAAVFAMQFLQAPSLLGLAALAIVTLLVAALAVALYALQGLDPSQALAMVGVISVFLLALEGVCLAATAVGAVAGLAIPGLAIMLGFVAALGLVVLGLAALAMDVIAGMPKLGSDLSAFMTNVQPFITGIQNIPDNISDKIGTLCTAILKLTGTDLVNAIANFLSGGSSLADLGQELLTFGTGMAAFSNSIGNIDAAVSALSKIKNIQSAIEGVDLSGLSKIGKSLKSYSDKVSAMNIGAINLSVNAAILLMNLAKRIGSADFSGVSNFDIVPLGKKLKQYSATASAVDASAVSSSISAANRIVSFIKSLVGLDISGISNFKAGVDQLSKVSISKVTSTFRSGASQMQRSGTELLNSVAKGMQSGQGSMVKTAQTLVTTTYKAITARKSLFVSAGKELMNSMNRGMSSQRSVISATARSITTSASSGLRTSYSSFYSAGSYLAQGFANGITASSFRARAAAAAMARSALTAAEKTLVIGSPSKETYKLGGYFGLGFINAVNDYSDRVYDSSAKMAESAKRGLSDAISKVGAFIEDGVDTRPVISPVVDMSDVTSGVDRINSLFGENGSIGLRANINAMNSAIDRRRQNGTEDRVASSIDKLRKELNDGLSRPSYTINGITYDNGSEVADAIQTLVRAAKIERRV